MTDTHAPGATDPGARHDWGGDGFQLMREAEVMAPAVDAAIGWLAGQVPDDAGVLDVGCGPGVAACSFAALMPEAVVVAADASPALLDLARNRAAVLRVSDRVSTLLVDLRRDIQVGPRVDLVWAGDVVHHLPDPVLALRTLGSQLRPGGFLAVREGGLPVRFLPDAVAPGLQPRLDGHVETDVTDTGTPDAGWPELMAQAGLRHTATRSFLVDLPAPLSTQTRQWLHARLARIRGHLADAAGARLTGQDDAALDELLDPMAPGGLLLRPDVFVLTAATVYTAQL